MKKIYKNPVLYIIIRFYFITLATTVETKGELFILKYKIIDFKYNYYSLI